MFGCCTSGMNEWQLQEVLRSRWLTEGVVINDEPHFLAGWEVMTNWKVNDAHREWNRPSADFVFLDGQGRLVVMELKREIQSPGESLRALCQVTCSAVSLAKAVTLDKLAELSSACRGGPTSGSQSDPVGLLRDAHAEFFSITSPAPLLGSGSDALWLPSSSAPVGQRWWSSSRPPPMTNCKPISNRTFGLRAPVTVRCRALSVWITLGLDVRRR